MAPPIWCRVRCSPSAGIPPVEVVDAEHGGLVAVLWSASVARSTGPEPRASQSLLAND